MLKFPKEVARFRLELVETRVLWVGPINRGRTREPYPGFSSEVFPHESFLTTVSLRQLTGDSLSGWET